MLLSVFPRIKGPFDKKANKTAIRIIIILPTSSGFTD
jgi:hypothetical protein